MRNAWYYFLKVFLLVHFNKSTHFQSCPSYQLRKNHFNWSLFWEHTSLKFKQYRTSEHFENHFWRFSTTENSRPAEFSHKVCKFNSICTILPKRFLKHDFEVLIKIPYIFFIFSYMLLYVNTLSYKSFFKKSAKPYIFKHFLILTLFFFSAWRPCSGCLENQIMQY